jgi:glycosyltransferase involved in cell wall biosynthesis
MLFRFMTDAGTAADSHGIDITVAVSCYNEESLVIGTLNNVVSAATQLGLSYEIVVIDDASRDNSAAKIRQYIAAYPDLPIRLKINPTNRGLGYVYAEAAFAGSGKYYRLTCGDDGEPKEVLVNLFRHIGKADMVIPYNYKRVEGKGLARDLLSGCYTTLVNLISGYNIHYYNGLAIHLRYNVIRWPSSSYGFGFQADIITRLLDEGASYLQVPSYSINKKKNTSTALSVRNVLSVTHTFFEIAIRRLRNALYGRRAPRPVEVKLVETSNLY